MSSTDPPPYILWAGKKYNIEGSKKPLQARPVRSSATSSSSTHVILPTQDQTPEAYTPASTPYHSPRPEEPPSYFIGSESESEDFSEDDDHPWGREHSPSLYQELNDLCRIQNCRFQEPLRACLQRRGTLKTLSTPEKNIYSSHPNHICITQPKRVAPLALLPAGGTLAAVTAASALSGKARARAALQQRLMSQRMIRTPYMNVTRDSPVGFLQRSGAINFTPPS